MVLNEFLLAKVIESNERVPVSKQDNSSWINEMTGKVYREDELEDFTPIEFPEGVSFNNLPDKGYINIIEIDLKNMIYHVFPLNMILNQWELSSIYSKDLINRLTSNKDTGVIRYQYIAENKVFIESAKL